MPQFLCFSIAFQSINHLRSAVVVRVGSSGGSEVTKDLAGMSLLGKETDSVWTIFQMLFFLIVMSSQRL